MIQSHEMPEYEVTVGNKVFVNYNIVEKIGEEGTTFTYEQAIFDSNVSKEIRDANVAKLITAANKVNRQLELDELVAEVNTVPFDADTTSIGYMSAVVSIANFKAIQALYEAAMINTTPSDIELMIIQAYEGVYKQTKAWRNANNVTSNVQIETVAEALEVSMRSVAEKLGV